MLECFCNAWGWLGINSGQIQILVGLIALSFAVLAYFKILEQIKISQDQTEFTQQQRALDLRLNILRLINENFEINMKNIILIDLVLTKMEALKSKLIEINDKDSVKIGELISRMASSKLKTEDIKKNLVEVYDNFESKEEFNHDQFKGFINTLAGSLVQSSSNSFEYTTMMHEIELIKKEKNLK